MVELMLPGWWFANNFCSNMPYPLPSSAPPPIVQVKSDRATTSQQSILEPKPETNQLVTLNTAESLLPTPLQASKSAAGLGKPISVDSALQGSTTAAQDSETTSSSSEIQASVESVAQAPASTTEIHSPEIVPKSVDQPSPVVVETPLETQIPPTTQSVETPVEIQTPTETAPSQGNPSNVAPVSSRIVELNADRQEYDEQRQIVTAEGNVILRLNGGVIDANSLQVNLSNRIAVGQGDVAVTRGEQVLRGERFTYNFVQNTGELLNASGEIFIPSASQDLSVNLATDVSAGGVRANPPSDRITANQPRQDVTSTGGIG